MVFASPDAPRDAGLAPLPGSRDEGRRVAERLARFAPTLLEGAGASEHAAKAQLTSAAFVHFATHGLVSEIRPADSSLVLAEGNGEDGYLRAAEIYGLELTANLIVLSGCSTATGRVTGDGVFGLPRAFMYAGTPSIVASLWDVSDRATVSLMDRFYRELLRTGNKAGALRTAQLETRRQYPHPGLWAPFVLIGEPR
jgi:CHAT domain-containing protein